MIPRRQLLREVCIFGSAEKEAVQEHRASVVTDLAPSEAEAKDEGGGRGLEADDLGHESLSAQSSFPWSWRRQKSGRGRKPRRRAKHVSCRTSHPAGASCGWMSRDMGLAGMSSEGQFEASVIEWPHRSHRLSRRRRRKLSSPRGC